MRCPHLLQYCEVSSTLCFDCLGDVKSVGEADREQCHDPVIVEHIIYSIEQLKNNKSPGTDGISAEFYTTVYRTVSPFSVGGLLGLMVYLLSFKSNQIKSNQIKFYLSHTHG